ncbi:MAG: GHMP kinase [Candidatus Methylomirabilales bacterium]
MGQHRVRRKLSTVSLIVTRAPFRVSFAGGGTDLPSFYEREYGAVLSTTIDKYVYVIINRRGPLFKDGIGLSCSPLSPIRGDVEGLERSSDPFQYPIRVSYSSTENVQKVEELQHPIVREALRLLEIDDPMDIATVADVPARTGLGSSSSFAVALLHAVHTFKGEEVSVAQLASEAAHIEIDRLGRPIGKQDHYAAAFGGLNLFRFHTDGDVSVQPLSPPELAEQYLFPYIMLLYTGVLRDASSVLAEQKAKTADRYVDLIAIRDHAHQLERMLRDGFEIEELGRLLHKTWLHKRNLASGISNSFIDRWYERALAAGALGGKICGAGGGGFLLLVTRPEKRQFVREALAELPAMEVAFEPRGSQLLLS